MVNSSILTKADVGAYLRTCDQTILSAGTPTPTDMNPIGTVRFLPIAHTQPNLKALDVGEFLNQSGVRATVLGRRFVVMGKESLDRLTADPEWGFQLKPCLDKLSARKVGDS